MTEAEYVIELKSRWPKTIGDEVSPETRAVVEAAVAAFPASARLWVIRGDLIQLGPEDGTYSLDDALQPYRPAVKADPRCDDAWKSIGHFYDAVMDDEPTSLAYFGGGQAVAAGPTSVGRPH